MAGGRVKPYSASIKAKRIETLGLLHSKYGVREIAEARNVSYQAARKAVKKLISLGLVVVKAQGFFLTKRGKDELKLAYGKHQVGSYQRQRNLVRLHDLQFQLKVLSPAHWATGLQKIFKIKKINHTLNDKLGWKSPQYIFYVDEIQVRTTPNFVLILPNDIYGATASEAKKAATALLYQMVPKLENMLRVKLSKDSKVSIKITREHDALIYNEVAEWFLKHNMELRIYDERGDLRLIVDDSLNLKELEAVHKRYAEQDADKLKTFLSEVTLSDVSLTDMGKRLDKLVILGENLAKANVSMLSSINMLLGNKLGETGVSAPQPTFKNENGYIG